MRDAIYDLGRSDEGDIKIGDTFESLLRVGTQRGVRNSPEIILMTRAFVILESLTSSLSPHYNWVESFRREVTRMTAQRYSSEGLKSRTIHTARELERLAFDGPGDARRVFRRVAEGDLGRLEFPALETVGGSVIRAIGRLASVIGAGALVVGGALLATATSPGTAWHHPLGENIFIVGLVAMFVILIVSFVADRTRR
jgi:ubiquinone biosynthesis protein